MNGTLTGMPSVDELIRQIMGRDDGEDDGDAGDWAGITELVEIFPTRLDGVSGPASGIPALMAKAARRPVATRVLKADAAKRQTLHVAYPVDAVDRSRALDGARDFVKADALEAGAHEFMKAGAQVGTDHRDGTTGAGTCLESWIHRAPPWTMTAVDGSQQTVHTGDWCVLIQWSPAAWSRFQKGDLNGVSMQGNAKRRRPPASALAGVRKAAKMPRCGKCRKRARTAGDKFCGKCGAPFGKAVAKAAPGPGAAERAELAKSVAVEAAHRAVQAEDWAGWLLKRALSGDPAVRGDALGRIDSEFGEGTAVRLMSGELTPQAIGSRVAKSAAVAGMTKCRTCKGAGRLRHPSTGKPSRKCPSCQGSGQYSPDGDKADMTSEDASLFTEYAGKARSRGMDAPDGLGKLIALVGADTAMKVMTGAEVSPAEFRRGYISACRANQSAVAGQEPRIPDPTHVPAVDDFRRPVLTVRQSRPAPVSVWPGQGGQADYYHGGAGSVADDGFGGLRNVSTGPGAPALAASARFGG